MEGTITNFRRGRHRQHDSQMIIQLEDVTSSEKAKGFLGKKVTWKSPANKVINGEITSAHGNKGSLRVKFATGMPGQSIGTKVTVA